MNTVNPIHPRSSINPNTKDMKKTAPRHYQNAQTQLEGKSHYVQRYKDKDKGRFLIRNKPTEKTAEHHLLKS